MGNCCTSAQSESCSPEIESVSRSQYKVTDTPYKKPSKSKTLPIRTNIEPLIPEISEKYRNSLTIVIDLDETIVNGRSLCLKRESEIAGDDLRLLIRPYTLELLYACKKRGMEIIIWSAGVKYYVLSALHYVLLGRLELIDHIIWRDTRWHPRDTTDTVPKDMALLNRDMSKSIIIDNHPLNIIANPNNGILISDFDERMSKRYIRGGDETLSRDYTLLGLISTIYSIDCSYSENRTDIRNILSDLADDEFYFLKRRDVIGCYCFNLHTMKKSEYIDILKTNLEHSQYLVRYVAGDYPIICDTLQILTPKRRILEKMERSHLPLAPIRSHLTINPFLIERRYDAMNRYVMQHYDSDPFYETEYDHVVDIGTEIFNSKDMRKSSVRMYGTF
jgi:NLI interacting factor-like phosphatase